jgi:hypothetical protein
MKPTRFASLWFPMARSAHLPAFSKLPTWTRLPMAPASLCEPLSPFSRQEDDEIRTWVKEHKRPNFARATFTILDGHDQRKDMPGRLYNG